MRSGAFDVAVIGAGPGGIAAAATAAENGLSVVVIDESPRPGGQIWRHLSRSSLPRVANQWLHRLDRSGARVLSGTSVVDVTGDANGFCVATQTHAGEARSFPADAVVIATGARERFIPFPGWTLPGVVGVGGGQALLKAGAHVRGKRIIVAGSGPLLLPVAAALSRGGARVTHVLEQAPAARVARFATGLWRSPSRIIQAAMYRAQSIGARYIMGAWAGSAEGTERVHGVRITNGRTESAEPCDMLCVGYGLVPSTEVAALLGCDTDRNRIVTDATQRTSVENVYAVGESSGVAGVDAALLEGQLAALSIFATSPQGNNVKVVSRIPRLARAVANQRAFALRMDVAFELRGELRQLARPETIVCRCEDVTLGAIARCESMREAKLHTRAGMGPCQGRVCTPSMQLLFGWSESSVRPPLVPAPITTFLDTPAAAAHR